MPTSTLAKRIETFISGLTITTGELHGSPFKVLGWERRFLRRAFRAGVSEYACSVARKNGKSALCAGIVLSAFHPDGPLHRPRGETAIVSSALPQSKIIMRDVVAMLRAMPGGDDSRYRVVDNDQRGSITDKSTGTVVMAMSSDHRRAHGWRPTLVVCDEPAQWPPGKSGFLIAAVRTGLIGGRLLAIGTRSSSQDHWFSQLLDEYGDTYAAGQSDDPFALATWRKANPSWSHLPELGTKSGGRLDGRRKT